MNLANQFRTEIEGMRLLLDAHGEKAWALELEGINRMVDSDLREAARRFLANCGGSGTLTDVILFADGSARIEANDEFAHRRTVAYRIAKAATVGR